MLRRGDHSAARLQLDREELDWQRANSKTQKEQEFREWIQRPEAREEFLPKSKGASARKLCGKLRRNCTCYESSPKTAATPAPNSGLSSGV